MKTGLNDMTVCDRETTTLSRDWCIGDMASCLESQLKMLADAADDVEQLSTSRVELRAPALIKSAVG